MLSWLRCANDEGVFLYALQAFGDTLQPVVQIAAGVWHKPDAGAMTDKPQYGRAGNYGYTYRDQNNRD